MLTKNPERVAAPGETAVLKRIARRLKRMEDRLKTAREPKELIAIVETEFESVVSDIGDLGTCSDAFAEASAIASARRGDPSELIKYLRSHRPVTPRLKGVVADVIEGALPRRSLAPPEPTLTPLFEIALIARQLEHELRRSGYSNKVPGPDGRLAPIHKETARLVSEHLGRPQLEQQAAELLRRGREANPYKGVLAWVRYISAWIDEVMTLLKTSPR